MEINVVEWAKEVHWFLYSNQWIKYIQRQTDRTSWYGCIHEMLLQFYSHLMCQSYRSTWSNFSYNNSHFLIFWHGLKCLPSVLRSMCFDVSTGQFHVVSRTALDGRSQWRFWWLRDGHWQPSPSSSITHWAASPGCMLHSILAIESGGDQKIDGRTSSCTSYFVRLSNFIPFSYSL